MMLPTFSMVTETPDGWIVGVNPVSLVFGRSVVLPAEWTSFIPKAAPRFCIEYSADCSDERRVVEGSIFCATHLAQVSGEYRIDREETPMSNLSHRADPSSAGCWIDGHWGQYGVARMVEIAAGHGYSGTDSCADPSDRDPEIVDIAARHLASMGPSSSPEISDEEHEALSWAADSVEAWLNANVAPEGFSFGWADGEFFLWSDAQWETGDLYEFGGDAVAGRCADCGDSLLRADEGCGSPSILGFNVTHWSEMACVTQHDDGPIVRIV